ncbi:MAG: quinone-dependent dihydroorotate dehydrogenase [Pseudomonadota bacterium]
MRGLAAMARPLLLSLDPEQAHDAAIKALRMGLYPRSSRAHDPALNVEQFGLTFPNPVGMAAGFDKNGEVPVQLLDAGFGFTEVGSVTPRPQPGNPKPRVFRVPNQAGVINRLGFNNDGHDVVDERLHALRRPRVGVLGVNIGANKDSPDRVEDYRLGVERFKALADYITVNVSSPNTPGLRGLQDGEDLDRLLGGVIDARGESGPPILLKVAPDLDAEQIDAIADAVTRFEVDGLIVSNTTLDRATITGEPHAGEAGGLSGKPLFHRSTVILARFYRATRGKVPLVGVGGVTTPADAVEKLRAGASLVQLYTGLIYGGFELLDDILVGLTNAVKREGVANVSALSGTAVDEWADKEL